MTRRAVLALDQGTTSCRAMVFDERGAARAVAQREFRQIFPDPGEVEHDAREIARTQLAVAREALDSAGLGRRDVDAIGITNQRETTVVWDRATGEPIHNAIVWQDRRTAADCERLRSDGHESTIKRKTGLVLDAYFSGTKVAWLLDHVPGARDRAAAGELAFGTIDSWLVWQLTEGRVHATDASNASRTMLYDIHRNTWDDELLEILRVPRALLPDVRASSEVYGEATVDGLAGIPVAGIAGDQHAALFGQACFETGSAKCTYGTGCFVLMNTGGAVPPAGTSLLSTVAWRLGSDTTYAIEGSIFIGGAVVQWLRDGLKIIESSTEVEALAASVPDSGGVQLVPAFAGLGAPYWDPHARGILCGLTRGTTRAHVARAALEGIAHQVADVLQAMRHEAGIELPELRVDGGAAANALLMQIQSDLLGVPLARPRNVETTALGAAFLAGLAVGVWADLDAVRDTVEVDRRWKPQRSPAETATLRERWARAVERARG